MFRTLLLRQSRRRIYLYLPDNPDFQNKYGENESLKNSGVFVL